MVFQVFDCIFCTAILSGVEARTTAVVGSCLGSGDGSDKGKQWLRHQLGLGDLIPSLLQRS